jgi:outer membrane receptor protein involved in Fe transport
VTEDALLYYTWSQGFRPGGFNRGTAEISPSSPLYGIFKQPISFSPDTLINNELGWKTEWFDHRFLFNGAVYQEDWKNAQISIFDPGVTGNLTFTTNGPDYRVRGLEIETVARITHGLTLTAAASWNTSELTNAPSLVGLNGQPITIANPYGAQGTPLAESPPFQGNLRARYEFTVNDYKAFWQIGGKHQAHSYATTDRLTTEVNPVTPGAPGASIAYDMPGYSTYDGSLGIGKDAWSAELYGQNLTDARAITYESYSEFVRNATIIRPRTLGLKFHYKF